MLIQKGPIQVMIGLIFKEKQQLALVIKNPSHQVRHIKNIKIVNTGSVETIKIFRKKEGYTVNNIKMSLFPAYKSFLFCNFAI